MAGKTGLTTTGLDAMPGALRLRSIVLADRKGAKP